MTCELCNALPQHVRTLRSHEHLRQIGVTQRIARPGRGKAAWITEYVCELCETEWQHVDDPCDRHAGWSILRVPEYFG